MADDDGNGTRRRYPGIEGVTGTGNPEDDSGARYARVRHYRGRWKYWSGVFSEMAWKVEIMPCKFPRTPSGCPDRA